MLIIENINNLVGTKLKLGKYEINCMDVNEYFQEFTSDDNYAYVIDFKLPVKNNVELVLWLNREQVPEMEGWKLTNNLVDGELWIKNKDVESFDNLIKSLQVYIDICADSITTQFINDFAI
jgi:hypothetical protein